MKISDKIDERLWQTADGSEIYVWDLAYRHLDNLIVWARDRLRNRVYTERDHRLLNAWLDIFITEQDRRNSIRGKKPMARFTRDKAYTIVGLEGGVISPMTLEEAKAAASESAHKIKGTVYILKVVSTVAPKFDTTEESW